MSDEAAEKPKVVVVKPIDDIALAKERERTTERQSMFAKVTSSGEWVYGLEAAFIRSIDEEDRNRLDVPRADDNNLNESGNTRAFDVPLS